MTPTQHRLAQKYLAYRALASMWFIGAVWLYFYRLFITDQQTGFLDGMAFAIGLLAEVPSGALADRFGRRRVAIIGQALAAAGLLIQLIGINFVPLFVGQAILMIGLAMISGADEALFFSRLQFSKASRQWRALATRGAQASLAGSFIALVVGGWAHTVNPRLPWLFTAIAFLLAAGLLWTIKDTAGAGKDRPSGHKLTQGAQDYLRTISIGFKQFRAPALKLYVPYILVVHGLLYVTGAGLLRPVLLDRFHFNPFIGSVVVAASSLIAILVLAYIHRKAASLRESVVLAAIGAGTAGALLLSVPALPWLGFVCIAALYVGERVLFPFMSEILQYHAPENQRATILSVASFYKTLPYLLLAPLIGALNVRNMLDVFLVGWAVLICIVLVRYLSAKKREAAVETPSGF